VGAQHVSEVGTQRQQHDRALQQHAVHEGTHRLHVTGHAIEDRARRVLIEEAEAEPLQLVEHARAQLRYQLHLQQLAGRHRVEVVEQAAQRRRHQHQSADQHEQLQRRPRRRLHAERPVRRSGTGLNRVARDVDR
jgi:hypothetical protein